MITQMRWSDGMSSRFDCKAALVTGAASGIGAATVARLALEGARVLAIDVYVSSLETLRSSSRTPPLA
jgi:meso-butanediol dehydrogenase / (S,S)-butanediol dehydrogenase / diacetyl reductase